MIEHPIRVSVAEVVRNASRIFVHSQDTSVSTTDPPVSAAGIDFDRFATAATIINQPFTYFRFSPPPSYEWDQSTAPTSGSLPVYATAKSMYFRKMALEC
jgi:hypothetical protein